MFTIGRRRRYISLVVSDYSGNKIHHLSMRDPGTDVRVEVRVEGDISFVDASITGLDAPGFTVAD